MHKIKYTLEIMEEVCKKSSSVADVIRNFGLREAGGNYSHIGKKIKKYGINTSHFKSPTAYLKPGINKKNAKEVLILRKNGRREKSKRLRRSMIEIGIEYKCIACKIGNIYNGFPIVLEIHHKNNNWLDDRKENLEFRCPNCHSQCK